MDKKIYIFIPTCGGNPLLERTLHSFTEADVPENIESIFIVENGEKFETEDLVEKFSNILPLRYLYCEKANKSNALNLALTYVPEESLVVLFDDDIRISKNCLNVYADAIQKLPENRFFGGAVGVDYEENPPSWLYDFLPASARGFDLGDERKEIDVPDFLGCNWAAFAKDLKRIGGFDSRFGPGSNSGTGQETTAMQKLLDNGAKAVYLPSAKVWHYVPPERCNEQWLKSRAYKMGLSDGYRSFSNFRGFFPYPKWLLRRRVQLYAKGLLYQMIQGREKSFFYFFKHQYVRGQIEGAKKAVVEKRSL